MRVEMPSNDTADFVQSVIFRAYAPKIGEAAEAFGRAVYEHTLLSLREMEGARYRTALINGCMSCQKGRPGRDLDTHLPGSDAPLERPMSARGPTPDDAFYEAVHDWRNSPVFSERERLAIELAERMGESPRSMAEDEVFWRAVKSSFTDAELVDLTLSIACWIALGRTAHTLEFDALCMPCSYVSRMADTH